MLLADEPDIRVVGEASNGHEAVSQATRLTPDVILMDIRMPQLDGLEATRQILARAAVTRVLILTTFSNDDYVYQALRRGSEWLRPQGRPAGAAPRCRTHGGRGQRSALAGRDPTGHPEVHRKGATRAPADAGRAHTHGSLRCSAS